MKRFILLVCLLPALLFAKEDLDIHVSKETLLDKRENYFLTATPDPLAPKVNPITGEYCEEALDLIVAGSQPLSLRRFYNHFAPHDSRYGKWRYNPECFFVANLEWEAQEQFTAIGEADGSITRFKKAFTFDAGPFALNGQTHPLNTKLHYWKNPDPKDKHRFEYRGTLTDGSGRVRTFKSSMHRWLHYVHYTEKKKGFGWSEDPHNLQGVTYRKILEITHYLYDYAGRLKTTIKPDGTELHRDYGT